MIKLLITFISFLCLSGCFDISHKLVIDEDNNALYTSTVILKKELINLYQMGSHDYDVNNENDRFSLCDEIAKDILPSISKINNNIETSENASRDGLSINCSVTLKGKLKDVVRVIKYVDFKDDVVSINVDFNDLKTKSDKDINAKMTGIAFSDAYFTYEVSGSNIEILETNGELNEDKNSLVYKDTLSNILLSNDPSNRFYAKFESDVSFFKKTSKFFEQTYQTLIAKITSKYDMSMLETKEGLVYVKGNKESFSGKMVGQYKNGQDKIYKEIENGLIYGDWNEWYENGKEKVVGNIDKGTGKVSYFNNDGNKIKEENYKNSLLKSFTDYNSVGQVLGEAGMYGLPLETTFVNLVNLVEEKLGINTNDQCIDFGNETVNELMDGKFDEWKTELNEIMNVNSESYALIYDYDNGNVCVVIPLLNNKVHGRYYRYHPNGKLVKYQTYRENELLGGYASYDKDGNECYSGNIHKESGEYISTWEGTCNKKIKLINNGVSSEFIHYYENGNIEKKLIYVDDLSDGVFEYYYENGNKKEEINYHKGKKEGKRTAWYENGNKKYEMTFKLDQINGNSRSWYENGQQETSGKYINGKLEGLMLVYWDDGNKKQEHTYIDGEMRGSYRQWHKNGNLALRAYVYKEENLGDTSNLQYDGAVITYYENGNKKIQERYIEGVENGVETVWYENGQKQSECNIVNGEYHGIYTSWYENGNIKTENVFEEGTAISYKEWYLNGDLAKTQVIKNGEMIENTYAPGEYSKKKESPTKPIVKEKIVTKKENVIVEKEETFKKPDTNSNQTGATNDTQTKESKTDPKDEIKENMKNLLDSMNSFFKDKMK